MSQSFRDFEVICIDDGSTDSSPAVLRHFAQTDGRFRIVRQKNQGAGAARNRGLKYTTGKYILFLDADDQFDPQMFECLKNRAEETGADICLCSGDYYDVKKKEHRGPAFLRERFLPNNDPFCWRDCADYFYQIANPSAWTKLYRKDFLTRYALRFQRLHLFNDVFFCYASMARAQKITAVRRKLMFYRTGMDTNLQASNHLFPLDVCKAFAALRRTLRRMGCLSALEQSLANKTIEMIFFNLDKLRQDPAAEAVATAALCRRYFKSLGITGRAESYFYKKKYFDRYSEMMDRFRKNRISTHFKRSARKAAAGNKPLRLLLTAYRKGRRLIHSLL